MTILDIGVIAVEIITILICYKRGLARTVSGILCSIISIFGAYFLGKFLSQAIYDFFIKNTIIDSFSSSMEDTFTSSATQVTNVYSDLPDFVKSIMGMFGFNPDSLNTSVNEIAKQQSNNIATAVESIIAPIIVAVILFFLFIILFFILRFVTGKISKVICKAVDMPVNRTVNKVLGGAFGIVDGIIVLYFVSSLAIILVPLLSGGNVTYLEFRHIANDSVLFKYFYHNNVITFILNTII